MSIVKEVPYSNERLIELLDKFSAEEHFRRRFGPEDEEDQEEDDVKIPSLFTTCFHEAA